MSAGRKTLESIYSDLTKGYATMALLGASSEDKLPLESPESLARYSDMMRPNIAAAIKSNEPALWFIYVFLSALLVTAITLTVLANLKGWGWLAAGGTIPGLGVTAVWPVRALIRLRRENLSLSLLPDLLPHLPAKDAAKVIKRMLEAS